MKEKMGGCEEIVGGISDQCLPSKDVSLIAPSVELLVEAARPLIQRQFFVERLVECQVDGLLQ